MSKSWPPSPCVEDEAASLAREHGSDSSDSETTHGKAPDGSQGAVDQYPIIQDLTSKEEPHRPQQKPNGEKTRNPTCNTAPQSQKPLIRPEEATEDRRFVLLPAFSAETSLKPSGKTLPRSKSTTRIDGDMTPRGRPHVTPINTDLGPNELHSMATGQRRAPSPYAYRPSSSTTQAPPDLRLKASFLSPETVAAPRSFDGEGQRARSARPDRRSIAIESSDSDNKPSRRRYRSKSRPRPKDAANETQVSADERYSSGRTERHRSRHRKLECSPPSTQQPHQRNHHSVHGSITPPQTPSLPRESPNASAAEDSDRRRRDKSRPRQPDRRHSKESPYTSAAEDCYKRWSGVENSAGTVSRRASMRRTDKPQIDLSNSRPSGRLDTSEPVSSRTPNAFEDYIHRAFQDNQRKPPRYGASKSGQPSPFSSPPTSPPRTPRGERKARDYFELNSPLSGPSKQRSRPPSIDENPIKPLTSLLSAAIGGSLAAKVIPVISRSSTVSLETPSSGSQSSLPSGQRSRKPSPVYEEPQATSSAGSGSAVSKEDVQGLRMNSQTGQYDRPISRAGSVASREENNPLRASTYPPYSDRPVSRAGSLNEPYLARATSYAAHDERPSSRNGSYTTAATPPPTQRAFSYSSPYEHPRPRPSQRRTYSSTNGAIVTPASSQQHHGPSNLSHSYTSPISTEKIPTLPTVVEAKSILLPVCPNSLPVTGFIQWYTIQGMQNFDICSTCMQVLGSSSFRDYCIPNPYRPPGTAVACSLGKPWVRIAVDRCLKDRTANISLLQNLSRLPPDVWPCPGKDTAVRKWYHVTDPSTKMPIPNFDVCTACIRSVELIFPELRQEKLFERPSDKLNQERVCNLNSSSKHFKSILYELELLAGYSRKQDLRSKDISKFAGIVRNKTKYRECQKDAMLATPLWHYIPGFLEFTICEECFNEVVWPLKDKPIARDVQKSLRMLPTYRPNEYIPGVSCQLYSERMRKVFREAVARNDFETLKQEAQMRHNVEHRLQEKQRLLELDMKAGIDRRVDMERNSALWKSYE